MNQFLEFEIHIKKFLDGQESFNSFEESFNNLYVKSGDDFLEKDNRFIEDLNDRLAFASSNPTLEDRGYGYIDENEFKEWLKKFTMNIY